MQRKIKVDINEEEVKHRTKKEQIAEIIKQKKEQEQRNKRRIKGRKNV